MRVRCANQRLADNKRVVLGFCELRRENGGSSGGKGSRCQLPTRGERFELLGFRTNNRKGRQHGSRLQITLALLR